MRSGLMKLLLCVVGAGLLGLAAGQMSNSSLKVREIDILDANGRSVLQLRGTEDGGEINFSDADDE